MLLTIYLKNNKKQVVNQSQAVLTDNKNRELKPDKLAEKMNSIARSIAGRMYLNHKYSLD
jgi:hypothetical protein